MTTSKQKKKERFFVKKFIKQIGWECEIDDKEEPDFEIQFPEKKVGLEITHLYKNEKERGSGIKRDEGERDKWLHKACKRYYEISDIPFSVTINIIEGVLDGSPNSLACELAQRNDIEVLEKKEFEFEPTDKCKLKVRIQRLPVKYKKYSIWTCDQNHTSGPPLLTKEIIQQKINGKARKLEEYKKKYNDIILLIALNADYGSGMFDFDNSKIENLDKCGFLSVHVFMDPPGQIKSY